MPSEGDGKISTEIHHQQVLILVLVECPRRGELEYSYREWEDKVLILVLVECPRRVKKVILMAIMFVGLVLILVLVECPRRVLCICCYCQCHQSKS